MWWLGLLLAFGVTWLIAPKMMQFLRKIGLIAIDQQKPGKPRLPTSGGLLVAAGMLSGLFWVVALNSFLRPWLNISYLLAACNTVLIITLIGFLDDLNISKRAVRTTGIRDFRIGLPQWLKPLLTLPAAIPLMAVAVGESTMAIPFIGKVDFGILYPLLLVPVAVVCVSNATNMLAGMNGLEAGMGLVLCFFSGLFALFRGNPEGGILALLLASSLLAFLRYNWYPARFLPGDSLTYLIGSVFVTTVILGNIEFFGIIVFLPWILEAFLKLRSRFRAASLGILQANGKLKSRYKSIYSLTHLVMKLGVTERQITEILISLEILLCLFAWIWLY